MFFLVFDKTNTVLSIPRGDLKGQGISYITRLWALCHRRNETALIFAFKLGLRAGRVWKCTVSGLKKTYGGGALVNLVSSQQVSANTLGWQTLLCEEFKKNNLRTVTLYTLRAHYWKKTRIGSVAVYLDAR